LDYFETILTGFSNLETIVCFFRFVMHPLKSTSYLLLVFNS